MGDTMTRYELAHHLKQAHPELREYDNDQLIDAVLKRRPDIAQHVVDERPQPAQPNYGTALGQSYIDMGKGALKEVGGAVVGLGDLASGHHEPGANDAALIPSNDAERMGAGITRFGTMAATGAAPEAAAAAIPSMFGRMAARGAIGAGQNIMRTGRVDSEAAGAGVINAAIPRFPNAAKGLKRWSVQNIVRLLDPKTQQEEKDALRLAARMIDEGMVPSGANLEEVTALANANKAGKDVVAEAAHEANVGSVFDARPVLSDLQDAIPESRAGVRVAAGMRPGTVKLTPGSELQTGKPNLNATRKVLADATAKATEQGPVTLGPGAPHAEMKFERAVAERARMDDLTNKFRSGRVAAAPGQQEAIETGGNSWRHHLDQQFPEYGTAIKDQSDLIKITSRLETLLKIEKTFGRSTAGMEASALAGANPFAPRPSWIALQAARMGFRSPTWLTTASATERVLADLMQNSDKAARFLSVASRSAAEDPNSSLRPLVAHKPRALPRPPHE